MPKKNLVLLLILALPNVSVHGQEVAEVTNAVLRSQVYELLTYQCGADEVEDQFRLSITKLGQEIQPLLISVLSNGLPEEIRKATQVQAERRFHRRQAWLRENGEELFGDETEQISAQSSEEFVVDAVRQINMLFRENAIRGLGVIGNEEAANAVQAALAQDAGLKFLAERALSEISQRD